MRRIPRVAALLVLIFASLQADALTLDSVLESVDTHYPEILAIDAQAEAQNFLLTRARGAFDPILDASYDRNLGDAYPSEYMSAGIKNQIPGTPIKVGAKWDRLNGKVPVYDGNLATGEEGRIKATVEIPLLRDLPIDKARAGVQTALLRYQEALEQSRLTRLNTYRLAALSYWVWVAAAEKQRTYETLLAVVKERDKVILTRVNRGESPRIDHVDNQRIIMQRQAQLEKARLEVQKATLKLSLFYRDENGRPKRPVINEAPAWLSPLAGDEIGDEEKLRSSLANHPSLTTLRQGLKQREVDQRLARYSVLPELDLRAGQAEYLGDLPLPRGAASETTVGLTFSFPLLNRDARGAAGAARLQVDAAQHRLRLAEQRLEIGFDETVVEARTAAEIYRLITNEVEFASQVESAERKRFQQGDSSLLNVNLREQDAILARLRAIEALLEFRDKQLELRLITNSWIRTY